MSTDRQPPQPAANDDSSALATLKTLLIGDEKDTIQRLEAETRDPKVQQQRVADSLPTSISKAYRDAPEELTRALELPVSECIEGSVERNPGLFADVLYPVMGPAIRRSITQAMRELVQHINRTLEHSLTIRGLSWRLEAARSGIPFAEIVLRHTLRYRVEEVFLIQSGSGLLIRHVSKNPDPVTDGDAVSAMLTAIRDFAHDTLDMEGEESRLDTVDVGDHTLWLIHGPKAYLACAIRGVPPVGLRDDLAKVLEEVHRRHSGMLEDFDGDTAEAVSIAPLLERCLRVETTGQSRRRFPWPLLLAALVLGGLIAWWGHGQWNMRTVANEHLALQTAAAATLSTAPGIVLTDWQIRDGVLQLQGLRDPLAAPPESILAQNGLAPDDYSLSFRDFESTDPTAALARARQRLQPPPEVTLELNDDGTLVATGTASKVWTTRAALLATTVPGISRYDDSRLGDLDDQVRKALREQLQPPGGVDIRVNEGIADLHGEAPLAWIRALPEDTPPIEGLNSLQHEDMQPLEIRRLHDLIERTEAATVDFASGTELDGEQIEKIRALATWVSEAHQHAQALQMPFQLQIIGRTDGTGSSEQNIYISQVRATRVARVLMESGAPMPEFRLHSIMQPPGRPDAEMRRVEFRVLPIQRAISPYRANG